MHTTEQRQDGADAGDGRFVLTLDDPGARSVERCGAKAAALSRIRRCGLPTLPGAVLTTELSELHDAGTPIEDLPALTAVLGHVAPDGGAVVVRSSSVAEDRDGSSAAGQFESVLDVSDERGLRSAVAAVYESRVRAGAAGRPIAVLVQPMLTPDVGGVLFGIDPVSGRSDRRVVTAVRGGPDRLVGGEVDGSRWVLDTGARVVEADVRDVELDDGHLADLVEVGDRLGEVLAGPQDVEWALVADEVVVLQSRPVTSEVRGVPSGPVYGPGPVAETFPDPLAPLEVDLWIPPLRRGVVAALELAGAVAVGVVDPEEVVVTVRGRAALDLEVTGEHRDRRTRWERLDLPGRVRRLRSAWRIGRMRVALPELADRLAEQVDRDLEAVPSLEDLSSRQLVAVIGRGQDALRSLHAHEILMGLVSDPTSSRFTGASVALRVLAESRQDGLADDEIVRRSPVVLALVPPKVGAVAELPREVTAAEIPADAADDTTGMHVHREALRLRVRWVQELLAQAATELGRRLARRGLLDAAADVARLRLDVLADVVARRRELTPSLLGDAAAAPEDVPPLPARFRLGDRGLPISLTESGRSGGGTGAGGGTGTGPVTLDADDPPDGSVLVVGALSPRLGPVLPRLAGLVAETGSVLSHLAILARESGVATVVGHAGATQDLAPGSVVTVDGTSGRVDTEDAASGHGATGATTEGGT